MEHKALMSYHISQDEIDELNRLMKGDNPRQVRNRAHAILLLLEDRMSYDDVANLLRVHVNSVRGWAERWVEQKIDGLYDLEGRGAKPIFSKEDEDIILECIEKEPRSLRKVADMVEQRTGKKAGIETYRRILKKLGKSWKRNRKITKGEPEPEEYEKAKSDVRELKQMAADGDIDLYFMDEAGFNLTPCIPCAWQDIGRDGTIGIRSSHSKRINCLGFMSPHLKDLVSFSREGNIDSDFVIEAVDQFAESRTKPAVVVTDNAPIHKSKAFASRIEYWEKLGVTFYFISPYSPELNLIEILWRKIKYEWLPNCAYESMSALRLALREILRAFGTKYYSIDFYGY
ncbi:MAG: IS630 family transposase [Azonexus sp.]